VSNGAGLQKGADISSSFIKDEAAEHDDMQEDCSFDSQSLASQNLPSFDGSKMFARKQTIATAVKSQPMNKENLARTQTARSNSSNRIPTAGVNKLQVKKMPS